MKKNQRTELHQKTVEELIKGVQDAHMELAQLHMDHVQGKLHNTGSMREVRKNIARMMTVIGEKRVQKTDTPVQPEKTKKKSVTKKKEDEQNA